MGFLGSLLSGIGDIVGLIPGVGTAVSAGAKLLGGALGSEATESENLSNQKDLMQMNQTWQSEENEKNRQFQSDEWTRQFDLVNAYNDPQAVAKRLRNAGINPNVAFSKGTTIAGSSASPSAPSGGTNMSPSPDYSGIITSGFQSMESLARRIKLMSEARGQDITNDYTGALLDSQIQKNLASYQSESAKADFTKFQLQLEKQFGRLRRSKELAKLESDILLQYQQGQLAVEQGKYYDMAAFNQSAQALLNYAKKYLTEEQATQLEIDIKYEEARLKSEIERNRGAAAAGYATAENQHAQAATENVLRQFKVGISEAETYFKRFEMGVAKAKPEELLNSIVESWKRNGLINEETYQTIRDKVAIADHAQRREMLQNFQRQQNLMLQYLEAGNDKLHEFDKMLLEGIKSVRR